MGTVGQAVTSYTATGLTPGSDYQFEVRALNANALQSDPSDVAQTFTYASTPGSVSDPITTSSSVILNWADAPGETGFSVERSLDDTNWSQIASTAQGVTTYIDPSVSPGTAYFYRIRSLNAAGQSDPSSEIIAMTATLAPDTVNSSATTAVGTLLHWDDLAGEAGFVVLKSTDGGNTFSQLGITAAGVTSYPVTGLLAGSNYQFEVESLNQAGNPSLPSSVASIVTLPAAPTSLLTSATTTAGTTLNWAAVNGATGFVLQRSTTGTGNWTTIATVPSTTLTYTDSALASGTNYYYQLIATNGGGSSAPSTISIALTIPAVPTATVAGLSTAQSQVSWNGVYRGNAVHRSALAGWVDKLDHRCDRQWSI